MFAAYYRQLPEFARRAIPPVHTNWYKNVVTIDIRHVTKLLVLKLKTVSVLSVCNFPIMPSHAFLLSKQCFSATPEI